VQAENIDMITRRILPLSLIHLSSTSPQTNSRNQAIVPPPPHQHLPRYVITGGQCKFFFFFRFKAFRCQLTQQLIHKTDIKSVNILLYYIYILTTSFGLEDHHQAVLINIYIYIYTSLKCQSKIDPPLSYLLMLNK
jgi:hypothetical protein